MTTRNFYTSRTYAKTLYIVSTDLGDIAAARLRQRYNFLSDIAAARLRQRLKSQILITNTLIQR